MTTLTLNAFSGEMPRVPADRLPQNMARYALNCDFRYAELRPLKGLGALFTVDAAAQPCRSVYTDDGINFFAWALPCSAYRSPTIDDSYDRVYYQRYGDGLRVAQAGNMKLATASPGPPTVSWKVGVTAPPAPTHTLGAATGGDPETIIAVAVAVNIWGEESAPSAPLTLTKEEGQSVTYSVTHTPDADEQALDGIVFYATYAGETNTSYFLLNESPAALSGGVASYNNTATAPASSTTLGSAEWDTPPSAPGNFVYVGNGFFCLSQGRDLVFSEPYRPHAWPYRMTLPYGIIGVVAVEGGILVTTQEQVYGIAGAHPSQMSQRLFPVEQAGWDQSSMTRVNGAAVYASNDGLVDSFAGQPSISASQKLFTRDDWYSRYGDARLNLRLAHHDGRLLGLVDPTYPVTVDLSAPADDPTRPDTFLLRLDESEGAYSRVAAGTTIYNAVVSGTTDQLLATTDTGFAQFADGADLTYEWHSRIHYFTRPVNFAAGSIDCDGSVAIEVYADGVLRHTLAATTQTYFRLPSGLAAQRWEVRLTGTATVHSVSLGTTFVELKQV